MTELSTADERSIRAIFDQLCDAWARGDARAYAALFADDCDFVAFDGTRLRGRAENEAAHRELFASFLAHTRLEGALEGVRALAPDVALAHASGAVVMPWQRGPTRDRRSRQTYVFVRREGQWQVAAFHNTRVRPAPPVEADSAAARVFRLVARLRTALAGRRPASQP